MGDPVEVELKLEYAPADRARLLASPLLQAAPAKARHLVATYFDTPDCRLDKAGYALRVRSDGSRHVQTLKASARAGAGLFVRGEWERDVPDNQPILDEQSGPLLQSVDAAALARIAPVFTTDVERIAGPIEHDGSLVEYAVDSGEVRAGRRKTLLSEIELELQLGSPQALFELARGLNEDVPLRLGVQSKSARGYALLRGAAQRAFKAEPIILDPDQGAGEAFAIIAASCIRHYRLNEPMLLDDGPVEAIHQARVALRRLRSTFALFAPLFEGDDRARVFAAELRWLAGELGTIRDIDVLLPLLDPAARQTLAAIRERQFVHLRGLLDSGRVRLLPIELAEWLAIGGWRTQPADPKLCARPIHRFAARRLDRLRRRIKRNGSGLRHLDDSHRHDIRKSAKKLRYASEFFVSLYPGKKAGRRRDRFLDRLEALQEKLGELNDLASAPALLARFDLEASLPAPGPNRRARLLDKAEDCFEALTDSKTFWKA